MIYIILAHNTYSHTTQYQQFKIQQERMCLS